MARKSKKSRPGAISQTTPYRYAPRARPPVPKLSKTLTLLPQSDLRVYHPQRPLFRPLAATRRSVTQIEAKQYQATRLNRQTKATLVFNGPESIPLCVRRRRRKQVLHAKGVAGSKNLKKPHRNFWSAISCKR